MLLRSFCRAGLMVVIFISGCTTAPPPPKLNPLQIQALQTQEFAEPKRETFNAVMTVLQNDGFIIQSANFKTGYITAKSTTRDQSFIVSDGSVSDDDVAIGLGLAAISIGVFAALASNGGFYGEPVFMGDVEPTHVTYAVTVTAFVTIFKRANKRSSKVRLNFVQNQVVSGSRNAASRDTQILDTRLYKKTFNAIRQQVFVAPDIG